MSDTSDLAVRTLQHLESRRCLLERLILIAQSLEALKSSLESLIDPLDGSEPPKTPALLGKQPTPCWPPQRRTASLGVSGALSGSGSPRPSA